jgi:signal transduction histidine kinase
VHGDVPLDGSARGVRADPWSRIAVLALAVTVVAVLLGDVTSPRRRAVAIGLLAVAACWCLLVRPRLPDDRLELRWRVPFLGVLFVLHVGAVLAAPTATFALFAFVPMVYASLPLWWALPPAALFVGVWPVTEWLIAGSPSRVLLLTALILVFSHAFAWAIDRMVGQAEELRETRESYARLSHDAGVAAERARMAGEIHDTLAQGFTSIVTLVQAAESRLDGDHEAARRYLALAAGTARENLAEARALVEATTPAELSGRSLDDALGRQVERLAEELGITAERSTTGTPRPLPTSVEVVLLRSAQEALNNVRKHAAASRATLELRFGAASVRLLVRDDGRGVGERPEGFGLRGMRARAEQVGGSLVVRGEPAGGTTVDLEVPL